MMGRIFLSVLLILLVGFGVIYWLKFMGNEKKEEVVQVEEKPEAPVVEPVEEEPAEEQPKAEETTDLRSIKVDYTELQGTETVRDGSRLTMVSLRAYGAKDFWIYIYLANRDQLNNPGEIRTGMILKIPKLDPRLIDASNPECIAIAKELEAKHMK